MSQRIKSSLYFASFILAAITYYNVGQLDIQELAVKKEIQKIENQTAPIVNSNDLSTISATILS